MSDRQILPADLLQIFQTHPDHVQPVADARIVPGLQECLIGIDALLELRQLPADLAAAFCQFLTFLDVRQCCTFFLRCCVFQMLFA